MTTKKKRNSLLQPNGIDKDYRAIGVAEGFITPKDVDEYRNAWQHLVNTGLAWRLQSWFGRTAAAMIAAGELEPANA